MMQGKKVKQTIHVPGTLAANLDIRFAAEGDATLLHVSAVASNDSDATLALGTAADSDGFLTATAIGDSGTPATFALADFDGALLTAAGEEFPRTVSGDVVVLTVDYDGAGGTAAADVTLVLTWAEG